MNIIEYIGSEGVKSTPASLMSVRMTKPRPGDIIDFTPVLGQYPFTQRYGRIEAVGTGWCEPDEVHICCEMGSAFLHAHGTLSISGGPFAVAKLSDLEPAFEMHTSRMWNWGDRGAGAGNGCHYDIQRPVFKLIRNPREGRS